MSEHVRRRRLLAALASGATLGGCSSLGGGGGDDDRDLTPAPVPTVSETPSGPGGAVPTEGAWTERVDVVALRGADRTVAVHPRPADDIRLAVGAGFQENGDYGGPAVLRVALRNRSAEPMLLSADVPLTPGDTVAYQRRGDGRLILRPTSGRQGVHLDSTRCWRSDADAARDMGAPPADTGEATSAPRTPVDATRLEPDAVVARDYWLLGLPTGPCLPTGLYTVGTGVDWRFTIAVWPTEAPGPAEDSALADRDPPPLPVRGRTVWFHEATRTTRVHLDPDAESFTAPGTARFVLRNHATEPLVGNPAAYELLKLVDGDWYSIVPGAVPTPPGRLPPGDRQPWRLALSNAPPESDTEGIPVGHLGGGDYAFRVGLARRGSARVHAALFGLDAPGAPLGPTPDLRVTRERDGMLRARAGGLEGGGQAVVAERSPAPDTTLHIPEQVMQSRGLRNTVGLLAARDAERARLRTTGVVADRLVPGGRRRLRLRTPTGLAGYELRRPGA